MNTSLDQGSAKIYQFPDRTRPAATESKRFETATIGSSWYHEEAIREAVRGYGKREVARASAVIVPLTFPRQ